MNARWIYQINGHYHFQLKVPRPFTNEFGCLFVKKSLSTDNLQEALAASRFIASQIKSLFLQAKYGIISKKNIKKAVWQLLSNIESIKGCTAMKHG